LPVNELPARLFGAILICRNTLHDPFDQRLLGRRRQGRPKKQSSASKRLSVKSHSVLATRSSFPFLRCGPLQGSIEISLWTVTSQVGFELAPQFLQRLPTVNPPSEGLLARRQRRQPRCAVSSNPQPTPGA